MRTTVREFLDSLKEDQRCVIEIIDEKKYDEYLKSDDLTWEKFCDMHILIADYDDLKASEAYKICGDFVIRDKYRKKDSIVLIVNCTAPEIESLRKIADKPLITPKEMLAMPR